MRENEAEAGLGAGRVPGAGVGRATGSGDEGTSSETPEGIRKLFSALLIAKRGQVAIHHGWSLSLSAAISCPLSATMRGVYLMQDRERLEAE